MHISMFFFINIIYEIMHTRSEFLWTKWAWARSFCRVSRSDSTRLSREVWLLSLLFLWSWRVQWNSGSSSLARTACPWGPLQRSTWNRQEVRSWTTWSLGRWRIFLCRIRLRCRWWFWWEKVRPRSGSRPLGSRTSSWIRGDWIFCVRNWPVWSHWRRAVWWLVQPQSCLFFIWIKMGC